MASGTHGGIVAGQGSGVNSLRSEQQGKHKVAQRAGGSGKAEGLGDGLARAKDAIAKLRLTLPPVSGFPGSCSQHWSHEDFPTLTGGRAGLYKTLMEKYSPDKKYRVMSREEVRAVDAWAINEIGVPGVALMENAGRSCAELIRDKLAGVSSPRVCLFCGTGNNGGDGFVIARHLLNAGFGVKVSLCGEREKTRGDAKINLDILVRLGQTVEPLDMTTGDLASRVRLPAGDADMIVDALFGTGLQGELREPYRSLIDSINILGRPVLAVDIPSGLDCDTGEPLGTAIKAACTVTFVAVKKGFVASPGAGKYIGELYIASIGVEPPA